MLVVVTPSDEDDLVTLERVKSELSITDDSEDLKLGDMIAEASAMIAGYCNREGFGFEDLRQTERLGCGVTSIMLERNLAPQIDAIMVGETLLDPTEYEVDGSFVYRLTDDERTYWEAAKVVIEYRSGFDLASASPPALSRAALDLVVGMYRGAGRDTGVRSEQVDGVGQTAYFDQRNSDALPLSADRLAALAPYRVFPRR